MSEEKNTTIEKLIEHENLMAELYSVYAQKFKYFSDFWQEIKEEEDDHALWISTLYEKHSAGLIESLDRAFPLSAIDTSIEYVKGKITEAKSDKDMTHSKALEIAVHIENAMLEHKFFEVFPGENSEFKIILDALRLSTEQHLKKVKAMWLRESGQMNSEMEERAE